MLVKKANVSGTDTRSSRWPFAEQANADAEGEVTQTGISGHACPPRAAQSAAQSAAW